MDEATATKFNTELEGQACWKKIIYHPRNSLLPGTAVPEVNVQGFDQDLPSKPDPLQPLADAIATDARGRYIITYDQEQFTDTEKQSADVVIVVTASDGVELYRTEVLYNIAREVMLDIELEEDPVTDRTSEFSRYIQEITPLLGQVAIADLTQEDLVFLTGKLQLTLLIFLISIRRMYGRWKTEIRLFRNSSTPCSEADIPHPFNDGSLKRWPIIWKAFRRLSIKRS